MNNTNNNDQMVIPEERDGIVDDEAIFEEQKKANEAQLKKEIKSAQKEDDELSIGDYEDREFIPFKYKDSNKDLKLAKRQRILGRGVFKVFAKTC